MLAVTVGLCVYAAGKVPAPGAPIAWSDLGGRIGSSLSLARAAGAGWRSPAQACGRCASGGSGAEADVRMCAGAWAWRGLGRLAPGLLRLRGLVEGTGLLCRSLSGRGSRLRWSARPRGLLKLGSVMAPMKQGVTNERHVGAGFAGAHSPALLMTPTTAAVVFVVRPC